MFAYMLIVSIMIVTFISGGTIGVGFGLVIGRLMVTND